MNYAGVNLFWRSGVQDDESHNEGCDYNRPGNKTATAKRLKIHIPYELLMMAKRVY
jgi:hypothetical protein